MSRVPNALSSFRLASAPVLLWLAWTGAMAPFLALFALALLSDVLDGVVARRYGLESEFGARLDQWADFAIWASFPLAAYWLWPEIVRREAGYVALALVCLLAPTAIATVRYGEVPGFHTLAAKLDAVLMGVGVPLLLLFDQPAVFRFAALFLVVCAIDQLAITALLTKCHHDVPSAFHALALRRGEDAAPTKEEWEKRDE